jgi:hypothetical protein
VPNPVLTGAGTLLTVTVTPGANPPSTGITVRGDLTGIGGAANQMFFDNGANGDLTANDNIFSFQAAIPANLATGLKVLPITLASVRFTAVVATAVLPSHTILLNCLTAVINP